MVVGGYGNICTLEKSHCRVGEESQGPGLEERKPVGKCNPFNSWAAAGVQARGGGRGEGCRAAGASGIQGEEFYLPLAPHRHSLPRWLPLLTPSLRWQPKAQGREIISKTKGKEISAKTPTPAQSNFTHDYFRDRPLLTNCPRPHSPPPMGSARN